MEIKLLTNEQEKKILETIINGYDLNDNGASRLVFLVSRQDLVNCGLTLDKGKDFVVKVALGIAGIHQTNIEASAYRNYGDYAPLAAIPYLGHYVEVMERVTPIDGVRDYDMCDYGIEGFAEILMDDLDLNEFDAQACANVVAQLEEINGGTSDNGQVGYDSNGMIVAYDYGYDVDSDFNLCSNIDKYIELYNHEDLDKYLRAIIEIIDMEDNAMEELESSLRNAYINSCNAD